MGWPGPVGVILGDGTALHQRCSETFHVERIRRLARNTHSPDAMADEAELTAGGEPLP
jgi:hypothetical protein